MPKDGLFAAASLDGMSRQWAFGTTDGALYSYFLNRPIDGMTALEFLAAGGVEFDRDIMDGEPFAEYLLEVLGDRAIEIHVGPHNAALTWADPEENGVRTHNLYWSDGTFNYALIADRSAVDLVNLGRSLVCGGT